MPNYFTSLSAFETLSVSLQATVNNIANMNSNSYKAEHVVLQTGPQGHGVEVARVYKDYTPGPAVISSISEVASRAMHDSEAQVVRHNDNVYQQGMHANEIARERIHQRDAESLHHWQEEELRAYENAASSYGKYYVEGSNSDVVRDFVNLNVIEASFSANAAIVRAQDDMTGTILNVIS